MGIRIQPLEIEVPENNPFENDLLNRKEQAVVLTHLVGKIEGPCVIAIDSIWGAGKSTFVRLWAQHLRNQKFPVVEFNAWDTDYSKSPFVTLSHELTEGIREYDGDGLKNEISKTLKTASVVLSSLLPTAIRAGVGEGLEINPVLEKEAGHAIASLVEKRLNSYSKNKKSIAKFKSALAEMATKLRNLNENKPLIVIIDELDRCRPSYAVELLEMAKHLFTVDHVVYVLAVNRSELSHSIRALYGNRFDAEGYLKRFFDVHFKLPEPNKGDFIEELLDRINIKNYFARTKDLSGRQESHLVQNMLKEHLDSPGIDVRSIAQAIHHLGLVFGSLSSNYKSFALSATVALILRTKNESLYYKYIRAEASELDVVKEMVNRSASNDRSQNHHNHLFEAALVIGAAEFSDMTVHQYLSTSPLLQEYRKTIELNPKEEDQFSIESYEESVIRCVERLINLIGFQHSVERLELFSSELNEE